MRRPVFRPPVSAIAFALAALALAPVPAGGATPPYGRFEGFRHDVEMLVTPRSIDLAAFSFRCGSTTGRTAINSVPIKRRRGVYRFRIRTFGSVTFDDGTPDENVAIRFRGRFSTTGRSVRGVFRVTSPHCRTGDRSWFARR